MSAAVSVGPVAEHGHARTVSSFSRPVNRRVRVDGVEARYLLAGSGPPVLLVASRLVTARSYLPLVRELAPWFTVVVLELPGSGRSDRTEGSWSYARTGAWLVELVRRLPLADPVVVGHSDSAPAAVEAARLAPDEMRALVLVDPLGAARPKGIARTVLAHARGAVLEPAFLLRATRAALGNALRHGRTFAEHVRAACNVDLEPAARALQIPTLLAWGERDTTVPLASATRLAGMIDGAKLVVGRGGHDWLATQPDAFTASLRRFLGEIRPRAASSPRASPRHP
jgi:pimeloyl-ACP methyl ester carboxylesterase